MAVLDLPGEEMSMVLLTGRKGCFVKGRITFGTTEQQVGDMAQDCAAAFMDAVPRVVMVEDQRSRK